MVVYLRSLLDVDVDHGPQPSGGRLGLLTCRTVLRSFVVPPKVTFCIVWLPF